LRYRMLVSDIDGTLLNSKGELTPDVVEAIREAHEQGILVTLATGRHLRGVLPLVEQIGVGVPVILGNGAVIVDPLKKETLLHKPLSQVTTQAILDVIRKHDLWASLFRHTWEGVDTYYDRDPGFDEAYLFVHKDNPAVAQQVEDLRAFVHQEPIKVLLVERPEKVRALVEDLKRLDYAFNMVVSDHDFPDYTFLEMFDHTSTKAAGISHLAEMFKLRPEEIVAVGDNVNDIEMVEYAGLGVAMGNAAPLLKEKADWVTRSNDEDGVAYLIREKLLGGTDSRSSKVSVVEG
jgi:Cof subfamily protein (haloacid dehalogenase superfamily)